MSALYPQAPTNVTHCQIELSLKSPGYIHAHKFSFVKKHILVHCITQSHYTNQLHPWGLAILAVATWSCTHLCSPSHYTLQ